MMLNMGFSSSFMDFIMHCISLVSYLVCLNGEMVERLAIQEGVIKEAKVSQRGPSILELPLKIKIMNWRFLNNYLPTQLNLFQRRLVGRLLVQRVIGKQWRPPEAPKFLRQKHLLVHKQLNSVWIWELRV
ncbi:hypothetical protein Goarm_021747 [Gossypium armourianum]|uniref:Uncharacterized protein n=1 Tax=Gossypium armourianum TaxID=34283 RepID=A0A7J9ISL6_9ROSI|nr:hypothetical protein [Gossypium armourianum]